MTNFTIALYCTIIHIINHFVFGVLFLFYNYFSNKTITQSGIMIIPPVALPRGTKITRINALEFERALHERSRSSKHRSSSRPDIRREQTHIIKLKT